MDTLISVCIPVYNASLYLRECIDSILSQSYKDFELLIVDDGSTDNSSAIVHSYNDPRIRLIQNNHNYIGSLNLLLKEAKGKYIARMDADDRMYPNRLQVQFDYMESHPKVDILGSGMQCFGENEETCEPYRTGEVGVLEFMECCAIYHPTVMMRKASIDAADMAYKQEYIYAEDYGFWAEALAKGLTIANIPDILLEYRVNPFQVSRTKRTAQHEHSVAIKAEMVRNWTKLVSQFLHEKAEIPISKNKLTAVIPFYNEGIEVGNTVKSIRETAGNSVDVIVINDHSDDGIDYQEMLDGWNVSYIENSHRMGPAVCKEKGVQCCTTPFFILLDAHMRFYQTDWVQLITEELEHNGRQITCCQTKPLTKIDGIVQEKEPYSTYGAFVYMGVKQYMPMAVWNPNSKVKALQDDHILCVLGATYASSKTYWNEINGFQGLLGYGCEEAFISLKAWMEGGMCKLISKVTVGHIYKEKSTYSYISPCYIHNYLLIAHLLFPTSLRCKAKAVAYSLNPSGFSHAMELLHANYDWLQQQKQAFGSLLKKYNMEYLKQINYVVHPEAYKDIEDRIQTIPDILSFCDSQQLHDSNVGLAHGKMALVVLYMIYYRSIQDSKWKNKAILLLAEIRRFLTQSSECLFSFAEGLAGIGWGLIYLRDCNLLSAEDTQSMLNLIDKRVSTLSPQRMFDSSLEYGYTGIAAYVTARLGYCKRANEEHLLNEDFIEELKQVCHNFATCSYSTNLYYQSINRLMSEYGSTDWSTMHTDIADIMELPTSYPKNKKHWQINLQTGCIGYALHLLTTQYHVNENQ